MKKKDKNLVLYNFRFFSSLVGLALAVSISTKAATQPKEVWLLAEAPEVFAALTNLPPETSFHCEKPTIPVSLDFSFDLKLAHFDLAPFINTDRGHNPVAVRRVGTIEQDQAIVSGNKEVSTARFTRGFIGKNQQSAASNLTLSGFFYFCDYNSLPEFVGGEVTVSGEIGSYTVNHQKTIDIDASELSLTYKSQKDISSDGRLTSPRKKAVFETRWNDVVGILQFDFSDKAIAFEAKDNGGVLLVGLTVDGELSLIEPGEDP